MARKKKRNTGPCLIDGCDKPSKAMNMCNTHYMQHRRGARDINGVLLRALKQSRDGVCKVGGCSDSITGKGYCSRHYQQVRTGARTEDGLAEGFRERNTGPRSLESTSRRECHLREGNCRLCASPMFHGKTRFCSKHYAQFRRGQIDDSGIELRPQMRAASYEGLVCIVVACDRRPKAYGLCDKHRQQKLSGIIDANGNKLREPQHKGPRGGKDHWTTSQGYIRKRAPSHPNADQYGFVLEHRLVVEKELGRYLERGEIVHHKDGDRSNNKPDNLELLTLKSHHPGRSYDKKTAVRSLLQEKSLPKSLRRELEKLN